MRLEIPEALDFSGEALPLQTPDIRERMDRELACKHLLAVQWVVVI